MTVKVATAIILMTCLFPTRILSQYTVKALMDLNWRIEYSYNRYPANVLDHFDEIRKKKFVLTQHIQTKAGTMTVEDKFQFRSLKNDSADETLDINFFEFVSRDSVHITTAVTTSDFNQYLVWLNDAAVLSGYTKVLYRPFDVRYERYGSDRQFIAVSVSTLTSDTHQILAGGGFIDKFTATRPIRFCLNVTKGVPKLKL